MFSAFKDSWLSLDKVNDNGQRELTSTELVPQSTSDKEVFYIRAGDQKTAVARANLLADMQKRGDILVNTLIAEYPDKPYTKLLKQRWGIEKLNEADPTSNLTAYTTDKSSISLCLRKNKGVFGDNLIDGNTLSYVLVHEMAHLGVNVQDHPPEFWSTFKELANVATEAGVFTYVNYSSKPVTYCSMQISSNVIDSETTPPV